MSAKYILKSNIDGKTKIEELDLITARELVIKCPELLNNIVPIDDELTDISFYFSVNLTNKTLVSKFSESVLIHLAKSNAFDILNNISDSQKTYNLYYESIIPKGEEYMINLIPEKFLDTKMLIKLCTYHPISIMYIPFEKQTQEIADLVGDETFYISGRLGLTVEFCVDYIRKDLLKEEYFKKLYKYHGIDSLKCALENTEFKISEQFKFELSLTDELEEF